MIRDVDGYCRATYDAGTMKTDIGKCWSNEENPAYFLIFAYHPTIWYVASESIYRSEATTIPLNTTKNLLLATRLVQVTNFYFGKLNLFSSYLLHEQKTEHDFLGKNTRLWLLGKDELDFTNTVTI